VFWHDALYLSGEARQVGPPSRQPERIAAIIAKWRELGPDATLERIAQSLGRIGEWGELPGDFKRDVRAAGGRDGIKRKARYLGPM
jgi:hypothetical protein